MSDDWTPRGEEFPKRCRIVRRGEFLLAFREGRRVSSRELRLVLRRNGLAHARLGLAVSRKVGNAVVRNRVKRRLREIFRRQRSRFPVDVDIVVIPNAGVVALAFSELEEIFIETVARGETALPPRKASSSGPDPGRE